MKSVFRVVAVLGLALAAVALPGRCRSLRGPDVAPDLALYEGVGRAMAQEVQRLAPGAGPWLVVAIDPAAHPRYAAQADAFKRAIRGSVHWHVLPAEKILRFESDGLSVAEVRSIAASNPGVKGVVLLGGALQPGGPPRSAAEPVMVAGPMGHEEAQAALASGSLASALAYRALTRSAASLPTAATFENFFEFMPASP